MRLPSLPICCWIRSPQQCNDIDLHPLVTERLFALASEKQTAFAKPISYEEPTNTLETET
jgi:hypothetical protein